jgi:hypothetical protein
MRKAATVQRSFEAFAFEQSSVTRRVGSIRAHTRIFNQSYAVAVAYVMYVSVLRMILRNMRMHRIGPVISSKYIHT